MPPLTKQNKAGLPSLLSAIFFYSESPYLASATTSPKSLVMCRKYLDISQLMLMADDSKLLVMFLETKEHLLF